MTWEQLKAHLETTGFPSAYDAFKKPQKPPYICYRYAYGNDLIASNRNIFSCGRVRIELYTTTKDPAAEKKVEDALKAAKIPYRKFEAWIEAIQLRQIVFDCSIPGL